MTNPKDLVKSLNAADTLPDPKTQTPEQVVKELNALPDYGPGRVSQGSAIIDSTKGIDHSFLDVETPFGISLPEQRAKNQTTTDKWLSGGIKGLSTFVTATGQTAGAVGGGIAATAMMALGNDFDSDLMFKNPVLDFFAKWNETVKERNPNYYSEAEVNASVIAGMGTANFWSDKFLDGVGFMASAIMTGYGAAKFGAQLGINVAGKIGSGFNTLQAALVGRTGESAIEANDAYEQTLEKLKASRLLGEHNLTDEEIEDRAKDARAATFGFNMAIAVTDAYQFGKIFKTIEGQAVKRSLFGGSRVGHAAEQVLIESQEENYQLAVADMAINMANNVTAKGTNANARDYFNNVVGGMMDNFSTKEGQESMLLGGLLGGGMGLAMHSNDRTKQMNRNVPEEIKKRNNKLMSVFNKDVDANYLERLAATQNDGIVEGLAKNLQLINLTLSKISEGTYDEFITELDEMAKQTPEQFKEIGVTVTAKDIKQQHSDAKNLIENYKALYDAMDPKVFDLKQDNAYEAIKANLFYVTAARNDIRTQLQQVGPYVAAVNVALKVEPELAMDEPFQVGKDQVIPQKVIEAQEKLVENRDALTKYINRVKTGKKLQKEIVDAYNQAQEVPTPVPTPKPKADPEIGSIQKVGKEGVPSKNIPFTKAVQLEDGSTNYTITDTEGLETIINDQKDSYTLVGYKGEFRGERQELNNNERYNFLQVFENFVSEEDLSRLQEILSFPNWKENIRITANKQNTGNVLERIKNFIAQKGTTTDIDNVYRTAVVGDNPMYLVPSSFIQIEMQIKDKDGNWTRMGHPGADPFKWRDKNGVALNFSSMTLEEFKDKFVFKQGTATAGVLIEPTQASLEQLQREQKESIKVYNAINDWYEKNGFSDLREIPEGFVKMFTRKMGFAFTKVGEWTKAKDFELDEGITSILRDNNENYVIIDMNTGRSIVDGKKYDVPAHIRKELGNTRYITKVNHPTIDDLYIKAAPGQLDGQDARDFIEQLTKVRENPTQDGADALNEILYVAYQGNWNFKFDVHTIKGTKTPKLVVDVFNDQLGESYKNIALPINISSLGTLQSLIEDGTDGAITLGRFAFKKHIAKDKLTNEEVERKFTFNTTPEIVNGINIQFKFNEQAPVESVTKTPAKDVYDDTERGDFVRAKAKVETEDKAKAQTAVGKKGNNGPVFKQSTEKASEVIHYNQALKWLEKILPKGISVADMATVTENLETQGYTWGMFANKVIYLSTQAQQGTEAHEAFHAIFRIMLTEGERAKLYTIAQAKWGKGKTPLFYEEKMADEFMAWKNARNRRVSGVLQSFFNKITQFAKFITGRESELERLFRKIDTGAFTNKELLNHQTHVYDAPVYKLLNGGDHYKMSVVKSENILYSTAAYVLEQLNNKMEYTNIPNAVKKLTTDYMFAQSTNYDIDMDVNKEIIAASDDKYIKEKMAELEAIYQNQENIDLVVAEVLKLVRTYEIRSIDTIIDEQDDTEESFKAFDIHQGEHGGWANVAKEIKQFIALTTYNTLDEFNKHITKSIDFVLVYGALQRRLAGKSRAQQLLSFESFARTDQQVNALWNKFLVETGYDPTTGTKTNEMMFNRFLNTFELESMDYMQSLRVKDKDGSLKLINMSANRANAEVIHFENWERKASEYNIFADQSKKDDLAEELIFDAAVGFGVDTSGVNKQNSMEFFEEHIRQIISTFGKLGIDLSEGYVLESLEEVHNIGTKLEGVDSDRQYRMLEEQDLLEIANLLKKGDNIFAQKIDKDGNILEKTGARGRLIAMASGDIHYRTDIYDANFQDAENKSRYAFVYPSYILTKIRDKHNITEAELQELKEDPYFKYNPLVQSAKSADWFLNLKAAFTGDYRDTVEDKDGKTFKSTTPKDLLLSWYGLYNKNKEYSYYTPMIYEAKSTSISVNLPNNVNDGKSWVDKKGEVTNETIKYFINTMFMQEHARIKGDTGITFIERKKNPWVTLPYFNGLKNKGNYITEYSQQDIIDNKDGVRITIGNAIKENLNTEITAHQTELMKYGIITNDKENKLLDSDIENITEYTADYYINDLVNSTAISQIIQGDLAKAKNPFDRVKRNGGELAYGTHFGEGTYKVVYKTEDKRKSDGIDRDDAQVYVSMKRRIEQLDRLGRLTDETRAILQKVADGQPLIVNDKIDEYAKIDLLPLKTVHYGDQDGYMVYHKMSETVLTRDLTSRLSTKDGVSVWVAKKGKEKLHNMLEFMEANEVDSIVTLSASKLENPSEALTDDEFVNGIPTMGERFTDLDNRYLRLQVETHSGKEKIVSGTQMAQLIDLLYETSPGLKDRYYQLLAETRAEDFTITEFMSKNATLLANKLVDSIETSGGDAQIVELLTVENGEFKYNFNLPHVAEKLEQLLLSHFSKGVLQQKVPGYKLTLMSSSGYMIEDSETGEARELKTHQISEDGKVIELAEAAMTRRALRKILGPKADTASIEEINKDLLEMVGTRIPTQAHHSMIPFKVVEFLPEYYGDTIIAPAGIVELSGADYDIDSLFVYRKAFFMDAEKNVHVYGEATTQKDKYAEYLNHHMSNLSIARTRRNREASYPGRSVEEIRQEVFAEYGLITNFDAYVAKGLPSNNSNRNNEIVDTYLTILTDPSVEDMFEPATLTLIEKAVADVHDTIRNKGNENATVNHYGSNGKLKAHTATSTGKRNVGPVAFINNVSAFMTKSKVKLTDAIEFLGKEYGDYGITTEKDIEVYKEDGQWKTREATRENQSKINSLSTLVSAMTDDAKHGFSAKLNLEEFNLGLFASMISLGIGFNRTMLFSSQDVLAELSSEIKSSGIPHEAALAAKIVEYEKKANMDAIPSLKAQDLVDNLLPGERTIERDVAVLHLYDSMQETTAKFQAVGTIVSLNKGAEVVNVIELNEKIKRVNEIDAKENGKYPFYTNLWESLMSNANTSTNMRILDSIKSQMSRWFISGIGTYDNIMEILDPSLKKFLKTQDKTTVDRAIKSFLTARGYQRMLEKHGSDMKISDFNALIEPGIKNELIEKTLAKQIEELSNQEDKQAAKDFNNNEFIKILRTQFKFTADGILNAKNESELDLVTSNMRIKRNPQTIDRITNGFVELSLDHPELAKNLFRYAMAKDSLQFNSTSFLKFLDVTYLAVASEGLDSIMDDPSGNAGMEFDFVKLFAGYSPNNTLFPAKNSQYLKSVGVFDIKDGTFTLKLPEDRKGLELPPYIFKTKGGQIYMKESAAGNIWTQLESFGDKYQLLYHMLYEEVTGAGIKSISPEVKVDKAQEIVPKAKVTPTIPTVKPPSKEMSQEKGNRLEYDNTSVPIEFTLGEEQAQALEGLLDFVTKESGISKTLQGSAGTGKTTIISFMERIIKKGGYPHNVLYMAPTHAATAVLGFETMKSGNRYLPATIASSLRDDYEGPGKTFAKKMQDRFSDFKPPLIIVDESSMLREDEIDGLEQAVEKFGGKIIFMGDIAQIPHVDPRNPAVKQVSKVFSAPDKIVLNEVYRQSKGPLLNLLTKIRRNTQFVNYKIAKVFESLKFLPAKDFSVEIIEDIKNNSENTVFISYTNKSVKGANARAREILGKGRYTEIGDSILGYIGYQNKQIEKQHLANSIKYTLTGIKDGPSDGAKILNVESENLGKLQDGGLQGVRREATTVYYQLENDDSLQFDLSQEQLAENNRQVSSVFKELYELVLRKADTNMSWRYFTESKRSITEKLASVELGDTYMYDHIQDKMVKFNAQGFQQLRSQLPIRLGNEFKFEKGIDYGHAITIHKSQGMTVDNVYFDLSSLTGIRDTEIHDRGRQINSEKNSMYYVGMSRAAKKLVVNATGIPFDETFDTTKDVSAEVEPTLAPPIEPGNKFLATKPLKMTLANEDKIKKGEKKATSRTFELAPGKYVLPKGTVIQLKGGFAESIDKLDDPNLWARMEGFEDLEDFKKNAAFKHTKEFIDGKGPGLYIYKLQVVEETPIVEYKGPSAFPKTKAEALAKKVRKSKNILSKKDGLDTLISYNFGKVIKRLSKAFGIKVEYVYQPDANWSGRYQHGVVQLNLALLQSDTPFHEFAHPFVEAIRIQNKALYDKLVAEIKKEGTILAKVIEEYPELDDAGRIDEAITTAIGMYGAKIANMPKTLVEKIKEFLQEIMRFIKGLFTPGTIFLPSELDPNTTLQDLGAIMAKNTQVFALGELTDEQAKYQKQQASKLTVDQDHVGQVANKTKTSSLREVDPDLEHKVGDKLAVYANSRSQGMIVELTAVKTLKSLKDIDKNKFAESLGYKDWADFTEQNKYAQKDSPAAQNFPALYNFLKGEGEMQWLQYEMVDIVPIGAESYLEDKIKRIKTVVKKQIDRYNSIITKKGSSEEKIKLFVKRRERLLKTIDAIDDASGVASYIEDAKKDLAAAKSELKELMNQIGNVRNLTDRKRKKAINDLHYIQEFIVAYDVIDKMSRDEIEDHLGDTELAKLFGEAKNDLDSIKKSIDKTAIPLLASWLLTFSDIDVDKANAYFEDQITRIQDNPRKSDGDKASLISKLMEKKAEMVLTQSSLEEQLRHAVRDVGFGSLWLEAAISSSDQVTSLFAKAVKFQEFQANFLDRMNQQKIGIALAAFEKEQGKAGNNIEKYYGELIQEVNIELGRDFDGSPLIEKRLVFRDVEDVKTPAGKELLSVLKEVYGEAQELLPESQNMKVEITNSKEIVDSLPFVRRSGADRIKSNGLWNTIKSEFQEIYKPLSTDTDYGYTTEAGEVIRSVPIHYTKRGVDDRAMDNKDVTKDIVDSVLKFSQMANKYNMFKAIQSEVEFMEGAIEDRTVPEITPAGNKKFDKVANIFGLKEFVKSDTARVNKRLQEFINMTFYGQHEKPNIETLFGHEIDTNKLLNFLGKWTGFTTLALNFLSALNNVILGNFYMFQESVARQNFGDLKLNLAEGKAIYYKGAARMVGDIGKIEGLSKETQLVRMYDAMQGSFRDISGGFVTGSKMKKLWQGSSLFFMNHIGEHEMQVSSLFAAMAGQKLTTKAGEEINLWDAYSLDDKGNLALRDDVEWYDTDVFAFQNKLHATNKSLHGNYNDFDKTVMQKYTLGRLALMFRKFMSPGVRRRFGRLSVDNELSELHEGFFVTTARLLRNEMVELKNWLTFKENNLTEHEKANLKKTIAEVGMWVTTMAMFAAAAGFLGDDDDSWAGALVLYEIKRLQTELGFYFNPAETLKIIKSPAATTTTIQRIIRLTDQLVHSVYDQEYTHYQTSGHGHKKGDSKVWDAVKDLVPAVQGIERSKHPEEAIKYFNKLF